MADEGSESDFKDALRVFWSKGGREVRASFSNKIQSTS